MMNSPCLSYSISPARKPSRISSPPQPCSSHGIHIDFSTVYSKILSLMSLFPQVSLVSVPICT